MENKIFNEDNLVTLGNMPENYLDLTVTSPPYNVNLGKNKYNNNPYDLYNDNKPHKDYISWLREVFSQIYIKTKKGGRCVINVGDGENGKVATHSDIIQMMKEIGWIPMATIIWEKNNVSSRTAWGSFNSPSSPSFPTPFEYILVFAKETLKIQEKGETDLEKQEFVDWSLSLWKMKTESIKKIGHPAPFPEELVKRCLKMLTYKNAIVYDPFMGSGTTAVVCKKLYRIYIGSEISTDYCNDAQKRLNQI